MTTRPHDDHLADHLGDELGAEGRRELAAARAIDPALDAELRQLEATVEQLRRLDAPVLDLSAEVGVPPVVAGRVRPATSARRWPWYAAVAALAFLLGMAAQAWVGGDRGTSPARQAGGVDVPRITEDELRDEERGADRTVELAPPAEALAPKQGDRPRLAWPAGARPNWRADEADRRLAAEWTAQPGRGDLARGLMALSRFSAKGIDGDSLE